MFKKGDQMTATEVSLIIGIIVGILAILGAIFSFFWSANKMAFFAGQFLTKVDSIGMSFSRFEKAFEKHTESEEVKAQAIWKQINGHGTTLTQHEQRIGVVEKAVHQ